LAPFSVAARVLATGPVSVGAERESVVGRALVPGGVPVGAVVALELVLAVARHS